MMGSSFISAIIVTAFFFSSALSLGVPAPIDLGFAKPYAVLAGSTITSTGVVGTTVNGDLGLHPGTAVTGFPPAILNGDSEIANAEALNAKQSLTTAYNRAAGLPHDTSLSSQDLGGMTLPPNVYNFGSSAAMNGMLTLDAQGHANAVWVFQIASSLLIAEGSSIIFKNDIGNPDYVYWQVGSSATLAKGVPMVGNVMAYASITVNGKAKVNGRCLALNAAVTLDNNVITRPKTVSFVAKQTISGISLEQYNTDPVLNSATLKEAIAETMTGVLPSNINDLQVSRGPTSAATTAERALSITSLVLNYEVVAGTTLTSAVLQYMLTNSVTIGLFDTYLGITAAANNATNLQSATSGLIQTLTVSEDDANTFTNSGGSTSSSSDRSTLSTGAIVGIVIGAAVGLVLFAMLTYFFLFKEDAAAAHKSSGVATSEV